MIGYAPESSSNYLCVPFGIGAISTVNVCDRLDIHEAKAFADMRYHNASTFHSCFFIILAGVGCRSRDDPYAVVVLVVRKTASKSFKLYCT